MGARGAARGRRPSADPRTPTFAAAGSRPGHVGREGLPDAWELRSPRLPSGAHITLRRSSFSATLGRVRRIRPALAEYAALDLETTGLDPARDRVIEIGAVAFTADQIISTLEQLVDPGRAVPDTVLRLTGIKQEELRGAANPDDALRRLAEFLRGRQPVGHGARLDVEFLEAAGLWDESQQILDTLDVARILLPDRKSTSLKFSHEGMSRMLPSA